MLPGISVLIKDQDLIKCLRGRRIAFLGNEASVDPEGRSGLMLLHGVDLTPVCAFSPQHGFYVEKQDNMIESDDFTDPVLGIPVFSLYGKERRPTSGMTDLFDVLIIDIQGMGVRVFTYVTTLFYMIEACAATGKEIRILDRPNPCGRKKEGLLLQEGWESFIGYEKMIMQHGLTPAELASWFIRKRNYDVDLHVVKMEGYNPAKAPGYGWPVFELPWVNPSPNAGGLNMARCYPGTCLIEGTTLSEGRGTIHPLEFIGAPDTDFTRVLKRMRKLQASWAEGAVIRLCHFEPVFDKYAGKLCSGIQIHTDMTGYEPEKFVPFRFISLLLKALRLEYPEYPLWREGEFEYETERLAIDLLAGSDFLRKWVDDPASKPGDMENKLKTDEQEWCEGTRDFYLYEGLEKK